MQRELPLRISLVRPPRGVAFALQRGRDDLLPPARVRDDLLVFDFTVRVASGAAGGTPNFLGAFAQGTPADRFVYLNSGTRAGRVGSCWERRAKVPLQGIAWKVIEEAFARPGTRLEVRIEGTAPDGGPVCATVPLEEGRWSLVQEAAAGSLN